MFERIEKATERLVAFGRVIAQCLIAYMMVHILIEIVLRVFFKTSTYSMNEFVGYALAGMVFFGMAETFYQRRHVRVGILIAALPPRPQKLLDLACLTLTGLVMAALTWIVWLTFLRDFERGSVSPTVMAVPTWIVDAIILVGLLIFLVQLIVTAIRTAISGMKPDASPLEG